MESEEELNILKCRMNSDNSILTTVLEKDIKFFETKNFKEIEGLSKKNIGHSISVFPIHRSNIIIILGAKSNPRFPENTVHLFDLEKQESIGSINIKEDPFQKDDILTEIFLANTYLFVVSRYKIYMFDLMTLEHEFTFEDVYGLEGGVSLSYSGHRIVLAYISTTNNSIVKINKIKIIKNGLEYSQRFLPTNFQKVQYIKISTNYKYLAVADSTGEKINVYSLSSYKIKKCLWRGSGNVKIISIFFDSDNNYIGLYSSQKTLHIYPISDLNIRRRQNFGGRRSNRPSISLNDKNKDIINEEDEEQMMAIKKKKKGNYGGFIKNMKKKLGNKYIESFARYKDDKVLFRDIVLMFFNEKNDVVIIDNTGTVLVVKFNKKSGGPCWLLENKKLDFNT